MQNKLQKKKKKPFSKILPILASVLACACVSKAAPAKDETYVFVIPPNTHAPPNTQVEPAPSQKKGWRAEALRELQEWAWDESRPPATRWAINPVHIDPPKDILDRFPTIKALFKHAKEVPGLHDAIFYDNRLIALKTLLTLVENPNFEPTMLETYRRLVHESSWEIRPSEIRRNQLRNEGEYFAFLTVVFQHKNLDLDMLNAIGSTLRYLETGGPVMPGTAREEKMDSATLGMFQKIISNPNSRTIHMAMANNIIQWNWKGNCVGKLKTLLGGIASGSLTQEMTDFYVSCCNKKEAMGKTGATILIIGILSNPNFKEAYFSRMRNSIAGFSEKEVEDADTEDFSYLLSALASNPAYKPELADAYGNEYLRAVKKLNDEDASDGFQSALMAYAGNARLDISNPRKVSNLLLSMQARGEKDCQDSKDAFFFLKDMLGHKNMGQEEFSLLGSLARKADKKAFSLYLGAFGKMLGHSSYSPQMPEEFSSAFSAICKLHGNKRIIALSRFQDLLGAEKEDSGVLEKSALLLGEKGADVLPTIAMLNSISGYGELNGTGFADKYAEAEAFAKSLGAKYSDPEVCANFAYGLSILGEKSVGELFSTRGIEYFARYSPELLTEFFRQLGSSGFEQAVLLVGGKQDSRGDLYKTSVYSEFTKDETVIGIETDSVQKIPKMIDSVLKNSGSIKALVLIAEGDSGGLQFGPRSKGASARLTSQNARLLRKVRGYFPQYAKVVVSSSNAGRGGHSIAAAISTHTKYNVVIAPKGKIKGVVYPTTDFGAIMPMSVPCQEYINGRIDRHQ